MAAVVAEMTVALKQSTSTSAPLSSRRAGQEELGGGGVAEHERARRVKAEAETELVRQELERSRRNEAAAAKEAAQEKARADAEIHALAEAHAVGRQEEEARRAAAEGRLLALRASSLQAYAEVEQVRGEL